jgi:hypothetical protein
MLYRVLMRIHAAPFVVFSVGVHALVIALLMQVQYQGNRKKDDVDLIVEARLVDEEKDLIDPKELLEKLAELQEEEVVVAKPTVTSSKVAETPMQVPPDTKAEVGEALDEDGVPGEGDFNDALDAINQIAMGDGGTMVVSVGDWDAGGGGGGGKGSYTKRLSRGHRAAAVKKFGGTQQTENAVLAGLAFLAKYQQADGHWSSAKDNFDQGMKGNYDIAITGMSLLCFLGAGHTEVSGKYSGVVSKAVNYLRRVQFGDGRWQDGHLFYTHGLCTMAMSEAFGMSGPRSKAAESAQRGINYIVSNQGETGGYNYAEPGKAGSSDTSVTGWQLMACKSAIIAGLKVPEDTMKRFEKFFDNQIDPVTGSTGYRSKGGGSIGMTSVGLVCQLFLGRTPKTHPVLEIAAQLIDKTGPQINSAYYIYYGTLGQFQMGGDYWKRWNEGFAMQTVARQVKKGKFAGSWDPEGVDFGTHGGRVYATGMYLLSLEVYYRYLPLYQK